MRIVRKRSQKNRHVQVNKATLMENKNDCPKGEELCCPNCWGDLTPIECGISECLSCPKYRKVTTVVLFDDYVIAMYWKGYAEGFERNIKDKRFGPNVARSIERVKNWKSDIKMVTEDK